MDKRIIDQDYCIIALSRKDHLNQRHQQQQQQQQQLALFAWPKIHRVLQSFCKLKLKQC